MTQKELLRALAEIVKRYHKLGGVVPSEILKEIEHE